MRYEAEFRACDVRDVSVRPGLRGRAVHGQGVHGRERRRQERSRTAQPGGEAFTLTRRQPVRPITSCGWTLNSEPWPTVR
jgi:hypothetical protein